jgi:hypothetical protein
MPRTVEKLSPLKVQKRKRPGLYGDGAGLWLHVGPTGGKSWVYRFMLAGTAREMGLGPLHTISLAEARQAAAECRKLRLAGIDPIDARDEKRKARRQEPRRRSPSRAARPNTSQRTEPAGGTPSTRPNRTRRSPPTPILSLANFPSQ